MNSDATVQVTRRDVLAVLAMSLAWVAVMVALFAAVISSSFVFTSDGKDTNPFLYWSVTLGLIGACFLNPLTLIYLYGLGRGWKA